MQSPGGKTVFSGKIIFLLIAGIVFLVFYYIFDPMQWGFMPQCVFHHITGLQCMGCGTQRALHSLLHGDLGEAFRANAFVVCSLPFLLALGVIELLRGKYPGIYAKVHSLGFIITVAMLLLVWFIARNILNL